MSTRNPLALLAILVLLLVACGGNDKAEPTPSKTVVPTSQAKPEAKATELPTSNPFANFGLTTSADKLEFINGSVDAVPEGVGVYYLNIQTKVLEGFHVPGGDPYGGPRFILSHDNRLAAAKEEHLLADRGSVTVYTWRAEAELVSTGSELASSGSRVLFRIPVEQGEDWFAIVDLDTTPQVVATFRAGGTVGLLSEDGTQALVIGDNLYLYDVAVDRLQQVDLVMPPNELVQPCRAYVDQIRSRTSGARVFNHVVRSSLNGTSFLLQTSLACSSGDGKESVWSHYTWDGKVLAQGFGRISPSPGGDFAWQAGDGAVPISNAIDLRTGNSVYRVVGATPGTAYPVLQVPPRGGVRAWATVRSGDLEPLSPDIYPPTAVFPAPDSSAIYAGRTLTSSLTVFDLEGNVITGFAGIYGGVGPTLTGIDSTVPPWGESSAEVRFVTQPTGSDDCCYSYSLVKPRMEEAPFVDPPRIDLYEEAKGESLYDTPGGEVVGELSETAAIEVLDSRTLGPEPPDDLNRVHCELLVSHAGLSTDCRGHYAGTWLRILTTAGQQGWLLVQANPVGL